MVRRHRHSAIVDTGPAGLVGAIGICLVSARAAIQPAFRNAPRVFHVWHQHVYSALFYVLPKLFAPEKRLAAGNRVPRVQRDVPQRFHLITWDRLLKPVEIERQRPLGDFHGKRYIESLMAVYEQFNPVSNRSARPF